MRQYPAAYQDQPVSFLNRLVGSDDTQLQPIRSPYTARYVSDTPTDHDMPKSPPAHIPTYTPYEGLNLANYMSRKLGVLGRKLEGSLYIFYWYCEQISGEINQLRALTLI